MSHLFNDFLADCKNFASSPKFNEKVHFVVGNESADLDSFVSTLVYAFYLHSKDQEKKKRFIPVILIPKDELELRGEVTTIIHKFGIPFEHLIFLHDIAFQEVISKNCVSVTLVDHNKMSKVEFLEELVNEIIDHHEDTLAFSNIKKTIKPVGSCCTLITEEIHNNNNTSLLLHYPIANLLLASVLVDTVNLDLRTGRTTELDVFMGELLCTYSDQDPDELFQLLQKAKQDISSMSTRNILRKDFKQLTTVTSSTIGMSSVLLEPLKLFSREDFSSISKKFLEDLNLNVLVIMFLYFPTDSTPCREMAVISLNSESLLDVCNHLLLFKEELQLDEKNLDNYLATERCMIRVFTQSVTSSRKFVLPLLQKMNFKV